MSYSMKFYNNKVYISQEEKRKKKAEEEKQRKEERDRKRKEQEERIKNMRKPNFVITKHSDGEKTGEVIKKLYSVICAFFQILIYQNS